MGINPAPFSINRNNMGKTCLDKLQRSILTGCRVPAQGIKNIYLMHVEDATLTFYGDGVIKTVTFATGAKAYKIEGYKQNIQVTTSVRAMDASNKMDISVMFKIPSRESGASLRLLAGRFYVLIESNDMYYYFAGSISPLECSGYDIDLNANGQLATVTLTAPEGSAGNYLQSIEAAAVNTILTNTSI